MAAAIVKEREIPLLVSSYHDHDIETEAADTIVEDAEQALVEGSFRQALQLANACLQGHSRSTLNTATSAIRRNDETTDAGCNATNSSENDTTILLETPIQFTFAPADSTETSRQRRRIRIDLRMHHHSPDADAADTDAAHPSQLRTDRAAAVALQSWFEISTKQSRQEQTRGYRHLVPLLKQYTTAPVQDAALQFSNRHHNSNGSSHGNSSSCTIAPNCSSMSLELMLVFVQFCHATGQYHMAVELSTELLAKVSALDYNNTPPLMMALMKEQHYQQQQRHCQELLTFVFTILLPNTDSSQAITNLGQRWTASNWAPPPKQWTTLGATESTASATALHRKPNPGVLQSILSLLDKDTGVFCEIPMLKDTASDCQAALERLLQELDSDQDGFAQHVLEEKNMEVAQDSLLLAQHDAQPQRSMSSLDSLVSWQQAASSWVARMVLWVRIRVRQAMQDPRGRATVAGAILTAFTAWHRQRRQRRLAMASDGSSDSAVSLVRTILQPLFEIIDAIAPA